VSRRGIMTVAVIGLVIMAPGLAFAQVYSELGVQTEQVVEGHNVYTVMQAVVNRNITGVTVLAREIVMAQGKLWFNDQYLLRPDQVQATLNTTNSGLVECGYKMNNTQYGCVRYPCGGAVAAVQAGHPSPGAAAKRTEYIESYYVTDPNDHTFIVDKYRKVAERNPNYQGRGEDLEKFFTDRNLPPPEQYTNKWFVWVANLRGSPVFVADDGNSNCNPFIDNPSAGYYEPTNPGNNGGASYCYDGNPALFGETPGGGCAYDAYNSTFDKSTKVQYHNYRRYNAELVFYMEDFVSGFTPNYAKTTVKGGKLHGNASDDTNGCESQAGGAKPWTEWYCPSGNDNKEGNSHPFNPTDNGGGKLKDHAHDTAFVDLYWYGSSRPAPEPAVRNYRIFDVEGSGAPFHLQ